MKRSMLGVLALASLLTFPAAAQPKKIAPAVPSVNLDPLHLFQTGTTIPVLGTPTSLYSSIGSIISGLQKFTVSDAQAALADAAALNISAPGTGYKTGDVITVAGLSVTVSTVSSAGGITAVTWTNGPGVFSVQPGANPLVTATGGSGTGAEFTQNDTQAAACWQVLGMVGATLTNPLPQAPGLLLAIQKTRDFSADSNSLLASIQSGPINQYCAPLITTTLQSINGLAAKGTAAAAAITVAVPK